MDGINLDALVATPVFLTGGSTYKEVLQRALVLISNECHWTQETYARDQSGKDVKPSDPTACQWCLLGAVARSSNELGLIPPQLMRYMTEMMYYHHGEQFANLGEMNDYFSHEVVVAFLQDCISRFN